MGGFSVYYYDERNNCHGPSTIAPIVSENRTARSSRGRVRFNRWGGVSLFAP